MLSITLVIHIYYLHRVNNILYGSINYKHFYPSFYSAIYYTLLIQLYFITHKLYYYIAHIYTYYYQYQEYVVNVYG